MKNYAERFRKLSDQELIQSFNKEVGCTGWVSARATYLYYLHKEFYRRNWNIDEISDGTGMSLRHKIFLIDKKVWRIFLN